MYIQVFALKKLEIIKSGIGYHLNRYRGFDSDLIFDESYLIGSLESASDCGNFLNIKLFDGRLCRAFSFQVLLMIHH